VLHRCARCGVVRPFVSSGRFRVNANRRRLDVWLIYRCQVCEATWNRAVITRRTPEQIGLPTLQAMQRNDPVVAARVAHDVSGLPVPDSAGDDPVGVSWSDPHVLETPHPAEGGRLVIRILLAIPVEVRLDRLLADQLGLTRSSLRGLVKRGSVQVQPDRKRALRRPVRDGTTVSIQLGDLVSRASCGSRHRTAECPCACTHTGARSSTRRRRTARG